MNTEIRELLEEAEVVEGGLSNHVYRTDDLIIKEYSRFPFTSFYTSLLEIFELKINYIDREERMRNEQEVPERIREAGFSTPDIIRVEDNFMVFERITGTPGFRFVDTASEEELRNLGESFRMFLDDLHSRGGAIRDCRISNYIIADEIYSIDHEYSGMNSTAFYRFIDEATLLASVRQTSGYHGFAEGFKPDRAVRIFSVLLALDHVLLFDREFERVRNIYRSIAA